MPESEFRKKTVYFFIFAALIAAALILFSFLEDGILAYLAARFGLIVAPDGSVSGEAGDNAARISEIYLYGLTGTVLLIFKVIMYMALVIAVVRFLGYLVIKTIYRNAPQGEISSLLKTVLSIVIYIVAFFIIFQSQFPGVQLAPLFTGSTIIGIVVGLALQDTLGNLFAGLALQADQSFQVGDVILISNGATGVVESVSWRGVKIRTFQNKLVVLSNAALGKEAIEIAPKNNLNARLVFFNTVYSASPDRTARLVREAVRQSENVSPKMRPVVRIRDLAADGIDWEVKYWLEDYSKQNDSDAAIRQRIWYVFQREKIDFAYPTRTVHVESKPEELEPEQLVTSISESLNRVSIFAPLSDEEIERLANASHSRVYAPGEAIVRIGQEGSSMFVVISGSVKVQIPEGTYQKTLTTLHENDFFGEMCLLTGEPRSASVLAVEETEVLRIDKAGLQPIFESNPALAESVYELIEERKQPIKTDADTEEENKKETRKGVLRSIKKFFSLK